MKVIKTNNFIKPLIVLIGIAATLMMPSQMAFAADEMIHPGDHKVSQNMSPDASTFDGVHSIVRYSSEVLILRLIRSLSQDMMRRINVGLF